MNLQKHSVTLRGHKTSISLETEFWDLLKSIAQEQQKPLSVLIAEIEENSRPLSGRSYNLSSALRVYILQKLLNQQK